MLCGEASYSLYLLHIVVIDAFSYEAAKISRRLPVLYQRSETLTHPASWPQSMAHRQLVEITE